MQSKILISAFFISIYAGLVSAAPILVRSGAHDGFTRLVLDVSAETDWLVENTLNSALIKIPGHASGFDLQRVFDRIDRTYVADLVSRPDALEVTFACRCSISTFKQGDKMIVLDVSPVSDALSGNVAFPDQSQAKLTSTRALEFTNDNVAASHSANSLQPLEWDSLVAKPTEFQSRDQPINLPGMRILNASRLKKEQQKIARQVGAAATRGLLKSKTTQFELPIIQSRPQVSTEVFDSSLEVRAVDISDPNLSDGNIKITSSSDIPGSVNPSYSSTTLGFRCIDPSVTSISDWVIDQPFSTQIATHRNELYSELDRLNHEAAVALARTYLHFGFGLEAKEVLTLHPKLKSENLALLEMAEIMEYGKVRYPEYLVNFMECDADIALWAILSKSSNEPDTSMNTSAALRALTGLPMHLRTFIAPELSRRFLEYGNTDAAEAALRSLERATQSLPSSADLAKANIELAEGKVTEAQDRLARVVSSNVEQSAEALIKFVDSHLEADGQIEQDIATLVEAYALQMRDDPIGTELERTHVLALGKSGQFNAAFEGLERLRNRNGAKTDEYVLAALLSLLAQNGTDIEFLDHVFNHISSLGNEVDTEALMEVADRLANLGFALETERILAMRSDIPDDEAARVVRAKVALSLLRPFEAEALLFGLDTVEAEILRARAKAQSGAFDEAHRLFVELNQEDASKQAAWLSNSWVALIDKDTPVFGDVARVAQVEIANDDNPEGMLSRTSDAILESAEARSVIEEMLRVTSANSSGVTSE